jgi:hypothetical protein
MAGSPTPRQTLQLLVEINRTADGRLEGRIRPDAAEVWTTFSGVLELLKVLEELVEDDPSGLPVSDKEPNPRRERNDHDQ